MRKGDLVRRHNVSNARITRQGEWRVPFDQPLLVIRGDHESYVSWSDRAISLSIAIDVMDPVTSEVFHGEPLCDFVRYEA